MNRYDLLSYALLIMLAIGIVLIFIPDGHRLLTLAGVSMTGSSLYFISEIKDKIS